MALVGRGRSDQRRTLSGQKRLELGASIALVGEDDLARPLIEEFVFGLEEVPERVTLVVFGVGERERDRKARRGADKVQAQPPEVPAMAGVLPIAGEADEVTALGRLPGTPALDGGRVHEPGVVEARLGLDRQKAHHRSQLRCRAPEPLVVAGLARHVTEEMTKVRCGVAEKARLRAEAQQGLDDDQGEASASFGQRPTSGRGRSSSGRIFSSSSILTYSSVARVSRSVSTGPPGQRRIVQRRSWTPFARKWWISARSGPPWNHSSR